jgi:phage terminase large subunit-like protein
MQSKTDDPESEEKLTRGEKNIVWIQKKCRIPEGKFVGQEVELTDWQKQIIKDIYDNPAGTRRAIVSFGRKNAKTTLSAFLLLLHLCGREKKENSSLYSAAQSRDQAAILFGLAAKIVRMSPYLKHAVRIRDTAKELLCEKLGTFYKALSAEASTAYGLSPVFIVHDELGQVKGPRSHLYEALETATGAQDEPLSIIISTQAPTDADLLSILIDDAKAAHDPRVVLSLYTADEKLDPFSEEAIVQANPAFRQFMNADEVLAMAEDARRMPSREAEYRNLVLNQRVEVHSPFVSRGLWESCIGEVVEDFKGLPVYGGLDLSETSDLTALVLIAWANGHWNVKPTFWLPSGGLREKAQKDRVPYDVWERDRFLETTPGRSVEYEYVAEYLRGVFDDLDIRSIAFDRWNFRHLKPWLENAGFSETELERFVEFGQGFQSMSPALRDLESAILQGKLLHSNHPVLNMCAANAVVQTDPAGNRKLSKVKSRGRIDGMVALAMAMSVAATHEDEPVLDIEAMIA